MLSTRRTKSKCVLGGRKPAKCMWMSPQEICCKPRRNHDFSNTTTSIPTDLLHCGSQIHFDHVVFSLSLLSYSVLSGSLCAGVLLFLLWKSKRETDQQRAQPPKSPPSSVCQLWAFQTGAAPLVAARTPRLYQLLPDLLGYRPRI